MNQDTAVRLEIQLLADGPEDTQTWITVRDVSDLWPIELLDVYRELRAEFRENAQLRVVRITTEVIA